MSKILTVLWRNKLYAALLAFVLSINLLIFLADRNAEISEGEKTSEAVEEQKEGPQEGSMFSEEDIKAREEKLKGLADENPRLYIFIGLLNLTIMFYVFIGILLDGYFLRRFLRKKPLQIRTAEPGECRWDIFDVIRVSLIFLSCGYVFMIAEGFAAGAMPIFENENFRMVTSTAVINVVGISVMLYFVVKKYGQSLASVGLTAKKAMANFFYAVVGYTALVPVIILIMVVTFFVVKWLKYEPPVQPIVKVFMEEKETGILWFSACFAAVFGPIAEEIFFRGFVYSALKKIAGVFGSMVLTSAVFSLLHAHVVGFMPIMALGMLLSYLFEKTGSLVPCMAVHVIHNLAMVLLVFLMRVVGT